MAAQFFGADYVQTQGPLPENEQGGRKHKTGRPHRRPAAYDSRVCLLLAQNQVVALAGLGIGIGLVHQHGDGAAQRRLHGVVNNGVIGRLVGG